MKKILYTIISFLLTTATLSSCGEDRSYEFYEQTEENQWILSKMKEVYLWNDRIKSPDRTSFFGNTKKFFTSLLVSGDNTSYFTDSIEETSYGLRFKIMRDPLGVRFNNYYALLLSVAPGSPAATAGLERGMWIASVDGTNITASSGALLQSGTAKQLGLARIDYNDDTEEYSWVDDGNVNINASAAVRESGILLDSIYDVRSQKLGYIVCENLAGETLCDEFQATLSEFISADVDFVALDLRYCDKGSVENVTAVASALVPATLVGTPFAVIKGGGESDDVIYNYSMPGINLGEKHLYIITNDDTKGVPELLAASLKDSRENVFVIGTKTAGATVLTETYLSPYGFSISPATAYICGAEGEHLPEDGVAPDYPIDELEEIQYVYPLGDEREYIMRNIQYIIINGTMPQ